MILCIFSLTNTLSICCDVASAILRLEAALKLMTKDDQVVMSYADICKAGVELGGSTFKKIFQPGMEIDAVAGDGRCFTRAMARSLFGKEAAFVDVVVAIVV